MVTNSDGLGSLFPPQAIPAVKRATLERLHTHLHARHDAVQLLNLSRQLRLNTPYNKSWQLMLAWWQHAPLQFTCPWHQEGVWACRSGNLDHT